MFMCGQNCESPIIFSAFNNTWHNIYNNYIFKYNMIIVIIIDKNKHLPTSIGLSLMI